MRLSRSAAPLALVLVLSACAPTVAIPTSNGPQIPVLFTESLAALTVPAPVAFGAVGDATPPEQFVIVPGCRHTAVQLRFVRQYGPEAIVTRCREVERSVAAAETGLGVLGGVVGGAILYVVSRLLSCGFPFVNRCL